MFTYTDGIYRVNHTIPDLYKDYKQLIAIEIPEKVELDRLKFDDNEFANYSALTVFIGRQDTQLIRNYSVTNQQKNQTVYAFFMQTTYLNCEMIHIYKTLLQMLIYAYGLTTIIFILNAVAQINYKIRFIQFLLCQLGALKVIFCLIVLAQWDRCPWAN